jgi:hypothetical protein
LLFYIQTQTFDNMKRHFGAFREQQCVPKLLPFTPKAPTRRSGPDIPTNIATEKILIGGNPPWLGFPVMADGVYKEHRQQGHKRYAPGRFRAFYESPEQLIKSGINVEMCQRGYFTKYSGLRLP